jgi:hypothetical protein
MDDVESRLGDVLGDPGWTVAPEGLADRVHRGVAVRRRRRRALAYAAAACAVVLAVGVPVAWRQIGGGDQTVANSIDGLEDLVDVPGSVALPKETNDAGDFFPEALGEDGSVLGRSDKAKRVWETGPEGGPLRALNVDAGAVPVTGSGIRVWPATNFVAPLYCRDQNGSTTQIMPANMVGSPLWVSGGTIVASDPLLRPWAAKGCTQAAQVPGISGQAVAFSYPDLFVADSFDAKGLRQVNVESGDVAAQRPLPEGVNVRTTGADRWQLWLAAANRDTFAWVVDGVLRTADRADWQVTEGPRVGRAVEFNWGLTGISKGKSQAMYAHLGAHLTAGNRLIVYTGHGEFDERTGWQSVVYDPRSGQSFEFQGVAYAAGDWLLWNDGTSYRLARVR